MRTTLFLESIELTHPAATALVSMLEHELIRTGLFLKKIQ